MLVIVMDIEVYVGLATGAVCVSYTLACRMVASVPVQIALYATWAGVMVSSIVAAALELRRFDDAFDNLARAIGAFENNALLCASDVISTYIYHVDVQLATVSTSRQLHVVRVAIIVLGVGFSCISIALYAISGYMVSVRVFDAGYIFAVLFGIVAMFTLAYCAGIDYIKHVVSTSENTLFADARGGCNGQWVTELDFDRSLEACTSNLDDTKCDLTKAIADVASLDTSRYAVLYFAYGVLLSMLLIGSVVGLTSGYRTIKRSS